MPTESSHYAIAVAFVLHFEHHSLVRLVSSCRIFGHHTVQSCAFKAPKPIGGNLSIAGCRSEMYRSFRRSEQRFQFASPLLKRFALEIAISKAKQVEEYK